MLHGAAPAPLHPAHRSVAPFPTGPLAFDGGATPYEQGLTVILWATGAVGVAWPLIALTCNERRARRQFAERRAAARGKPPPPLAEGACSCRAATAAFRLACMYFASCGAWAAATATVHLLGAP